MAQAKRTHIKIVSMTTLMSIHRASVTSGRDDALSKPDRGNWNEEVMAMLLESGQRCITQIWNQSDQVKLGIIWEYNPMPQDVPTHHYRENLPHAQRFGMVANHSRRACLTGAAKTALAPVQRPRQVRRRGKSKRRPAPDQRP